MTDQIKLGYWAIHGLAEPIRLILHYTKTPFTNKMYQRGGAPDYNPDVWLREKENLGLDFPNLPYLMINDLKITQSKAIMYYLGRKFNLMGTTLEEEAYVLMLCEEIHDLRLKCATLCYGTNEDFETERKEFVETTLFQYFKKFDDYLGKYKSKFIVGNHPTIADIQVYDCLDMCFLFDYENILPKKFGNVKRFVDEFISKFPELKDFIEKSNKEVPLNAPRK